MLIVLFGESCTGKSTLAKRLGEALSAKVYTGKDYQRLAKNEAEAKRAFIAMMEAACTGEHLIWVVSEPEQMALLPRGAFRVLVTASLPTIKERFAKRMGGTLPPPVAAMLERKHGCFDEAPRDVHIHEGEGADDLLAALKIQ